MHQLNKLESLKEEEKALKEASQLPECKIIYVIYFSFPLDKEINLEFGMKEEEEIKHSSRQMQKKETKKI